MGPSHIGPFNYKTGPSLILYGNETAAPVSYKLVPHAKDLLSSPASQAYVEQIFYVCGLLTSGRHNRMSKSLEMHACLKLN